MSDFKQLSTTVQTCLKYYRGPRDILKFHKFFCTNNAALLSLVYYPHARESQYDYTYQSTMDNYLDFPLQYLEFIEKFSYVSLDYRDFLYAHQRNPDVLYEDREILENAWRIVNETNPNIENALPSAKHFNDAQNSDSMHEIMSDNEDI